MNQLLTHGAVVRGESEAYTVRQFLGSGGEGEVYRVAGSHGDLALKWFYNHTATADKAEKLHALSSMPPPSPSFLWPQEIAGSPGTRFGYVMALRQPQYRGLADLLKAKVDPTFHALCTACMELAGSMHLLHARGLCYQDINDKNVFFRPDTGDVLICDCDNVCVTGSKATTVGGTLGFMAPEIVRGEAHPNADTDRFSLAVLLFKMLVRGHPLHGRKESLVHILDRAAKEKLYGNDPLFAFHPTDRSNAPVRGIHDTVLEYWPIYPLAIRKLFEKTFTDGIADAANGRVRENQWRQALSNARDSLFRCPACCVESFFDPAAAAGTARCWHCKAALPPPLRLAIEGLCQVALNHDTKLWPHHLQGAAKRYDFSAHLAEVSRHPQNAAIWGLRNLSRCAWRCWTAEGVETQVPPGKSAVIRDGLRLDFGGGITGRILWR